jgi:hypothetical protein
MDMSVLDMSSGFLAPLSLDAEERKTLKKTLNPKPQSSLDGFVPNTSKTEVRLCLFSTWVRASPCSFVARTKNPKKKP